jgi:hypothetical protein
LFNEVGKMPFNNQIAPERRDWSYLVFNGLPPGPGVLFEEVTLDERIGAEAVALLIDPKPDDLLASLSANLNLKAGIASTAYGPVLFLIWWVPIVNWRRSKRTASRESLCAFQTAKKFKVAHYHSGDSNCTTGKLL